MAWAWTKTGNKGRQSAWLCLKVMNSAQHHFLKLRKAVYCWCHRERTLDFCTSRLCVLALENEDHNRHFQPITGHFESVCSYLLLCKGRCIFISPQLKKAWHNGWQDNPGGKVAVPPSATTAHTATEPPKGRMDVSQWFFKRERDNKRNKTRARWGAGCSRAVSLGVSCYSWLDFQMLPTPAKLTKDIMCYDMWFLKIEIR